MSSSFIARTKPEARQGYLFNPWVDFLCLGGGSLIVFALATVLMPREDSTNAMVSTVMMAIANFVNHPHFAHSYQIFYNGYRRNAFGRNIPRDLRYRYAFAGMVVPALLVGFFLFCWLAGKPRLLGLGGNVMVFLVGWYYVKQGYGMLMVESVLKRRFFTDTQKKPLLINAYVVWVFPGCSATTGSRREACSASTTLTSLFRSGPLSRLAQRFLFPPRPWCECFGAATGLSPTHSPSMV
jgi:hypothetical protein